MKRGCCGTGCRGALALMEDNKTFVIPLERLSETHLEYLEIYRDSDCSGFFESHRQP